WLFVLVSELSQWGIWKLGNHEKQWRDWFAGSIPHFMSNLGVVLIGYVLWDAQELDDVIAWIISWTGLGVIMQWDKLLPFNVTMGAVLGYGFDKFGDQTGRLIQLIGPSISGKLGSIALAFKPSLKGDTHEP